MADDCFQTINMSDSSEPNSNDFIDNCVLATLDGNVKFDSNIFDRILSEDLTHICNPNDISQSNLNKLIFSLQTNSETSSVASPSSLSTNTSANISDDCDESSFSTDHSTNQNIKSDLSVTNSNTSSMEDDDDDDEIENNDDNEYDNSNDDDEDDDDDDDDDDYNENKVNSQMELRKRAGRVMRKSYNEIQHKHSRRSIKSSRQNVISKKKMKNCKHVWQFLRDQLKTKSQHVEWVKKEDGVFKILNQNEVARLWGDYKERKSKKPMDYEKMSRGIRHSRKDGFFRFIDKEQSYGVKLIYQFGEKAISNCTWLKSFVNNN